MFLSSNLQLTIIPMMQFSTKQPCYLATCNLALILSSKLQLGNVFTCNLQLSDAPILQLAIQQWSDLAICNSATFLSCTLKTWQCSYHLTCNLAMLLFCNLKLNEVPILQLTNQQFSILQLATQQYFCLATYNLAVLHLAACKLANSYLGTQQCLYLATYNLKTQQHTYLAICDLATFLFCNLLIRIVPILQLETCNLFLS